MNGHPVSDAERAEILAAYASGLSFAETAAQCERAAGTVAGIVRAAGQQRSQPEGLALYSQRVKTPAERARLSAAGKVGGRAVAASHPPEHFRRIGTRGGQANRTRHDEEYFQRLGHRGGSTTAERHGTAHYRAIGRQGAERKRELLSLGRAAEEQQS